MHVVYNLASRSRFVPEHPIMCAGRSRGQKQPAKADQHSGLHALVAGKQRPGSRRQKTACPAGVPGDLPWLEL